MDIVIGAYERAVTAIPFTARRIIAGAVDGSIPLILFHHVPAPLSLLPELEYPWDLLPRVWLLLPLAGYFVLYSLLSHWRWGRPLSKQIFRISVVRADGSRCSPWILVWRELVRGTSLVFMAIPFLPSRDTAPDLGIFGGFLIVGMIAVYFCAAVWIICPVISWKRGLHDYVSGTTVVGDVPRRMVNPFAHLSPIQREVVVALIFIPLVVVVAILFSYVLIIAGVLLAGFLVMDTWDRHANRVDPPGKPPDGTQHR